ncbi:hypothetical protein vBEcoMWL3_gp103c [Escherichia phage vB_EcoM_WL-3]|nr:hypothetical protein vBEcoMWL3_gp103c [Escherichia phage vB_EcoM_WL-3]
MKAHIKVLFILKMVFKHELLFLKLLKRTLL